MNLQSKLNFKGIYRDILYSKDRNIKYDSGWKANLIVSQARMLLAAFMRNDSPNGIQKFVVGKGDPSWDTSLPSPVETDTHLFDETTFFEIDKDELVIAYLDESIAVVEEGPTTRIQITATLGQNQPPPIAGSTIYPLREFGLFGLFDETPYMIDYVIHPVINKDATDTLIRTIRLIF